MSKKDRYKKKMKARALADVGTSTMLTNRQTDTYPHAKSHSKERLYKITSEPIEDSWMSDLPDEALDAIDEYHFLASHEPTRAIPELQDLISRFPQVPVFHNYLANAYNLSGQWREARQLAIETYKLFPDYLFAKTNYLFYLYSKGDLREAGKILNGKFAFNEHYPNRFEFHITEVVAFSYAAGLYLVKVGRLSEARQLCLVLDRVAPDDQLTQDFRDELEQADPAHKLRNEQADLGSDSVISGPSRRHGFFGEFLAKLLTRL